ncbi:MAG: ATP-binding cassette domain-containing protein [Candidatus Paceibacterota bacterium]|jgi:ABC-type polysaccharide/polyol phosphate transport system ATPase subunit
MKRIEVKNVSKIFHTSFKKDESALSHIINFIKGNRDKKDIVVLENISFDVNSGEILGIIGRNGSGKSTLLRLIAEVYEPNSGKIMTSGKVIYLTGLGQGTSSKLTMRENIYLMGSVMGLSQRDIKNKFEDIVAFSGLRDFVDMKVYQFSRGMISRLNFSTIIHCVRHHNPDILLLDEVLSGGGDIEFQEKAIEKMEELIKSGATVIMVSHGLNTIKEYCDKVIWLEKGKILKEGPPDDIAREYMQKTIGAGKKERFLDL